MRAFLGALAVVGYWLLMATHAYAEGWPYGVEPVPASYLHKVPSIPVFIHAVDDPNAVCSVIYGPPMENHWFDGCAVLLSMRCDAYIPTPGYHGYGAPIIEAIRIHEVQGHCNGLRHDHDTAMGWYRIKDGTEVKN